MKTLKINTSILLAFLFFTAAPLMAQQAEVKKEKKVVIITKTTDENGVTKTEKIVREGADAEDYLIEKKIDKLIEIDMDDQDFEKQIRIKIDPGADMDVIEWDGDGEMPEELDRLLKEKNIELEMDGEFNIFRFDSDDAPNRACLGVMIGMTEEIENINGTENVRTEGLSDLGVAILDVIENSGAADAGMLKEDVITSINGTTISTIDDVLEVLAPFESNEVISINYLRNGQASQVNATLKACGNVAAEEIEEEIEWEEGEQESFISEEEQASDLDLELLDIFPNPTDSKLTIQFKADALPTTVKVVDVNGREVYEEVLNDFDGAYNKVVDLSKAPAGTLILSIQQGDKVFLEKLILQK